MVLNRKLGQLRIWYRGVSETQMLDVHLDMTSTEQNIVVLGDDPVLNGDVSFKPTIVFFDDQ
jgi:hypothetical protein